MAGSSNGLHKEVITTPRRLVVNSLFVVKSARRLGDDTVLIVPVICDIIALDVSSCTHPLSACGCMFVDVWECMRDGGGLGNASSCVGTLHVWIQLVVWLCVSYFVGYQVRGCAITL